MEAKSLEILPRRPIIFGALSEAFGKIAVPIRFKLSFSFVGIVILMIGLALTSAFELRQANERALQLIAEQARMSALSNFRSSIQETMLSGAFLFAGTQGGAEPTGVLARQSSIQQARLRQPS